MEMEVEVEVEMEMETETERQMQPQTEIPNSDALDALDAFDVISAVFNGPDFDIVHIPRQISPPHANEIEIPSEVEADLERWTLALADLIFRFTALDLASEELLAAARGLGSGQDPYDTPAARRCGPDYFLNNPHKVMVDIDAAQQILSSISTECVMADVLHNTGTKIQNKVVVLHQNAQHAVSSARDKVERLCHYHGMRLHRRRRRQGDSSGSDGPSVATQQCNLCNLCNLCFNDPRTTNIVTCTNEKCGQRICRTCVSKLDSKIEGQQKILKSKSMCPFCLDALGGYEKIYI